MTETVTADSRMISPIALLLKRAGVTNMDICYNIIVKLCYRKLLIIKLIDSYIHVKVTTFFLVLHSNVKLITAFICFDSEHIFIRIIYIRLRVKWRSCRYIWTVIIFCETFNRNDTYNVRWNMHYCSSFKILKISNVSYLLDIIF